MRIHSLIAFCCWLSYSYSQQIDANFSRNGLLVFKELGMVSSHVIDFDVLEENKINVLYESDAKKKLVRLHNNGAKDIEFNITRGNLDNENTIPVAISSKLDGGVLVLSNLWDRNKWMVSISNFYENGSIDEGFGSRGVYKKNILNNLDDNYGQHIYVSSKDEIIVVAKVREFNPIQQNEKIAILKVSDVGETLFSNVYDDHYFTLNCSTMKDDHLLLAYSESIDNGLEQSTYLVGLDSDQMTSNNLDCFIMDEDYQSFDHIVAANMSLYTSYIQDPSDNLYQVRKYNSSGNLDESFNDSGEMSFSADIYNSEFVVNDVGEVFVVSTSLDNEFEILIKKILNDGSPDITFGDNGEASVFLKYPIIDLNKIRLAEKNGLYVSGAMRIEGDSYGFIARFKLNLAQQLKKERLEKFLDGLFSKE
ncbi:hypothetical protein [Aquimarina sp. MMG016]|uniref:hypothetical protein n=1 Tax=Aquimarina sp. MMG016 TaxID=2822690 RepID=UPI001B39DC9E|nr:hypothetical protein [Aquimarina sp. MMG016]MBQ4820444.1 hypothetical protein [Aquimarina sp. MMG016]